ncbi:MAG: AAA family ATPase, partial [Panacibacter sp.]
NMFWNKKDEPEKMEVPQPPVSLLPQKNYKFKQIKFYAVPETLIDERRPYRKVFEQEEITYMNWEIALFNRRFDDADWKGTITTKCFKIDAGKVEMCNIPADLNVSKGVDTYYYRYSWGTEAPGYWKAGVYLWEVYIDNELAGTDTMHINYFGSVTENNNPYFDLTAIRLYPSFEDLRETKEGYKYLTQFVAATTEYINVELEIKRKQSVSFNYELIYYVIKDEGNPKAVFVNTSVLPEGEIGKTAFIRYGWGVPQPGYWKKGSYVFYVNFMGRCIASAAFSVGDTEVAGVAGTLTHQGTGTSTHQNAVSTPPAKTTEELLLELDTLVGMKNVKQSITENIAYLQFNKIRMDKGFKDDSAMNLHSVFTGNPGTGKTTIVRLIGQIYHSMGLLSKGNVVEVGRAELIAEFIGQTAPKVKKVITEARGGVLFIDEAYALTRGDDDKKDFGQEAIEVILKEMSDGAGDIAVVVAGYPEEMQTFINSNPGLKSRFKQYFHFDDYLPEELMDISKIALQKEEATLDAHAEKSLKQYITTQYRSRDRMFGNARLMYGIIDEAKKQMGLRLLKKENLAALTSEELSTITAEDLQAILTETSRRKLTLSVEEKELKDALDELNELTGLTQIKKEISDVTSLVRFYAETGKDVLNKFSLHAILTGNPGTGKTTLARLLGKIYKALGLLERGHLVEVDRQSLVAGYIGQTAIKTSAIIDKAMGGVLFIDEAYALASGNDDFGQEAIETILKIMEDKRGQFAVITAGYTDNMDVFLKSNPGLKSRFDRYYNLPDYHPEELLQIAVHLFAMENMTLNGEAENYLQQYFNECYSSRDKYFGNARSVRLAVESAVTRQNLRLAVIPSAQRTSEMIQQVLLEDVNHLVISQQQRNSGIGFRKN